MSTVLNFSDVISFGMVMKKLTEIASNLDDIRREGLLNCQDGCSYPKARCV